MEESVERTTASGAHLTFAIHRAQRPPDRINVGLGSVDARQGDQLVTCAPGTAGVVHCATAGTAPPYAKEVDGQLAALRPYVNGAQALYTVAEVGGCFQLTLRLPAYPAPPYGHSAVFCFDPGTGAPAGSVIVRNEGTDRTRIVGAHFPASDADLAIPDAQQLHQGVPAP